MISKRWAIPFVRGAHRLLREDAQIPKRVQIEFQGLRLKAPTVRLVSNRDGTEIG